MPPPFGLLSSSLFCLPLESNMNASHGNKTLPLEAISCLTFSHRQSSSSDHSISMQDPAPHHPYASTSRPGNLDDNDDNWASKILRECARAIAEKDSAKIHHLLWITNELSSPYGDRDQKLASHFLRALFCKASESGSSFYKTLTSTAEKNHSFDTARKVMLKFQEVSPWTTFGHVISNGAILEALEGEAKLHIVDISNTYCTQWPTLLESLATRAEDTPHLRLTVVTAVGMERSIMKEVGQRMEKFARLMRVPFEFHVVTTVGSQLGELKGEDIGVREGEAVAVNCVGALRRVRVEERSSFIRMLCKLRPRVLTVVEEEADFTSNSNDFVKCFDECLRFYNAFFEMLEESFLPTSNERLVIERECSRGILSILACEGDHDHGAGERREKGSQWSRRLTEYLSSTSFSEDVMDDARALLRKYRSGWSLAAGQTGAAAAEGVYLAWKGEPVTWASAWKP
ncbi:protein SHORT-ROOT-like isoform X1 [Typha latifolia]|uniref:protein SHORT-ROOT-like isoform X1 n=1 Tax=Typha latifolia TaxID=4733 RepID=UPI003C2CCD31